MQKCAEVHRGVLAFAEACRGMWRCVWRCMEVCGGLCRVSLQLIRSANTNDLIGCGGDP